MHWKILRKPLDVKLKQPPEFVLWNLFFDDVWNVLMKENNRDCFSFSAFATAVDSLTHVFGKSI